MTVCLSDRPKDDRSNERGFTLVELMVVVAIISLLAAVVIPNFVHARAQAAVSATEANMKQIATALELFYADNQTYPSSQNTVTPALFGNGANPYLTSTPTNALGRAAYVYAITPAAAGKPASYLLTDKGPYDPTTLSSLTSGPGTGGLCATKCTIINYDPQDGFYGD